MLDLETSRNHFGRMDKEALRKERKHLASERIRVWSGFRSGNCEIVEVVTEVEVWVAFYRGKVTF